MADKEKKKKPKKKEDAKKEEVTSPPPEAEAPAPAAAETQKSPSGSLRQSSRGSRKAKRGGSSVFSMFSQKQVAEFKEAFLLMDSDKDGIIGKEDLRNTFNQVGRLATDKELNEMIGEVSSPLNFTQLLQLFGSRMQGGGDDDEVVIAAFKTFDNNGKIDGERLKRALMTYGDKFTSQEINEAYDHMFIDDKGMIDTESLIGMLTGKGEDEEE